MRKICCFSAVAVLMLCTVLALSSCGGEEHIFSNTVPMDLAGEDPGQYITLGQYKGLKISAREGENHDMAIWREVTARTVVKSLPEEQVAYYYDSRRLEYLYLAAEYGVKYERVLEIYGMTEAELYEKAKEMTKIDLVFYAIVQSEGITISETEFGENLDRYAAKIAADQGVSADYVKANMQDALADTMLYDKVSEFLIRNNNITDK